MIEEYLRIFCLSIIDDFNDRYNHVSPRTPELKKISSDYSEKDLAVRIGYYFRDRATFERKDRKGKDDKKGHNDLQVKSKDFKIEVKYPKAHKSIDGYENNKLPWEQVIPDFNWLQLELTKGHKGKRAFVIGWFNTDELNKLIQIGVGRGAYPKIGSDKGIYFPFVSFDKNTKQTDTVKYDYKKAGKQLVVELSDINEIMNCLFLGNEEDLFHFAIYY